MRIVHTQRTKPKVDPTCNYVHCSPCKQTFLCIINLFYLRKEFEEKMMMACKWYSVGTKCDTHYQPNSSTLQRK